MHPKRAHTIRWYEPKSHVHIAFAGPVHIQMDAKGQEEPPHSRISILNNQGAIIHAARPMILEFDSICPFAAAFGNQLPLTAGDNPAPLAQGVQQGKYSFRAYVAQSPDCVEMLDDQQDVIITS